MARRWIPDYQNNMGRELNLSIAIPEKYTETPASASAPFPVDEFVPPARVLLTEHLESLSGAWDNEKPPLERIQLVRDTILVSYKHIRAQEQLLKKEFRGSKFRVEDVFTENGAVKHIKFHKGNIRIGASVDRAVSLIIKVPTHLEDIYKKNDRYVSLMSNATVCKESRHLAKLYFEPLLRTEKEIAHFILDVAMLADSNDDLKYLLRYGLQNVNLKDICSAVENSDLLITTLHSFESNTFEEALDFAKTVGHHYNQIVGTNLSLEQVMQKYLIEFPPSFNFPFQLFHLLGRHKTKFNFSFLMEDLVKVGY